MNYDDIWIRNQVTSLARDLQELKDQLKFHNQLLQMQSYRVSKLEEDNRAVMASPSVKEYKAVDAYRKSIRIVERIRDDVFTRNILDQKAKEWVLATITDIIAELRAQVDYCEGKI